MSALQELMGHRDFNTTLIYADYAPSEQEADWAEAAFRSDASASDRPHNMPEWTEEKAL